MGYNRDTFSLVLARDGMKLPAGNLTFLRIKIGSDGCNPCGITNKYHTIRKLLRF